MEFQKLSDDRHSKIFVLEKLLLNAWQVHGEDSGIAKCLTKSGEQCVDSISLITRHKTRWHKTRWLPSLRNSTFHVSYQLLIQTLLRTFIKILLRSVIAHVDSIFFVLDSTLSAAHTQLFLFFFWRSNEIIRLNQIEFYSAGNLFPRTFLFEIFDSLCRFWSL